MTKLDELIEKLCPEGVEYKRLGDVVVLIMGTSPDGNTIKEDSTNGMEFHQGKTYFGKIIINPSPLYSNKPIKIAKLNNLIMSVRAPVGEINMLDRNIAIGRGLCAMEGKKDINIKFLYYYLSNNIFEIKKLSTGSTFESINTNDIKNISIPVPPLPIQEEIVRILDSFTTLTAELEAELEARKKQYEYYRDKLLTFKEKV